MKNFTYLLAIAAATVCLTSVFVNASPNGLYPGDDEKAPLSLGQGVNSATGDAAGFCVGLGQLRTQSGNVTGQTAEFQLLEIDSETSLRESLDVTASGSLSFGLFGGGSARMRFANSVNKNSRSKYLMVHTRVANQIELASSFELTQEAQKLAQNSGANTTRFIKQCGDHFIYGRRTGGEFFALFEFEMRSDEESKQFSTAVQASGMGWKAAAEINSSLAQMNVFAQTQLKMLRLGATGAFPEVENLQDFARKFPDMVATVNSGAVTLQLISKDYSGVEPLTLRQPNQEDLNRQRIVLDQIAKMRDRGLETLSTVTYIQDHASRFRLPSGTQSLSVAQVDLNEYINTVLESASECFANVYTGCRLPTVRFPSINFPEEKNCESVSKEVCALASESGCLIYKIVTINECK